MAKVIVIDNITKLHKHFIIVCVINAYQRFIICPLQNHIFLEIFASTL